MLFLPIAILLLYGIRYCRATFPIASGFGAKVLCSAIFVARRKEEDAKAQELSFFPLNLVSCKVNYQDSSVTCSILGSARRKAIYRKGLGATLLSRRTENQVRSQPIHPPVSPAASAAALKWPQGDQATDHIPANIDTLQLERAMDNCFKEINPAKPTIGTRAVVVVYDGRLIAEKYAPGFDRESRLAGWSMTKSITGALTGILVKQNRLPVDEPAPVQEWSHTGDLRRAITIKHLLQQTSGLDFTEDYTKSSEVTRMLFQQDDMGAYAATRKLKHPPGSVFNYSSGNSNILSRIIRQVVGEKDYHAFPYQQLFYKTGMYRAIMEPDASGTFAGSSFCYATAQDWARFGLLYLNDGVWDNERLLPEGWVKQSVTPAPAAVAGEYGYHFWLNAGPKDNPSKRPYPLLPSDMYYASGFEGQNVFIIPSRKLVVVRLGLTRDKQYSADNYLAGIIQSIH
jgi:CubicO group peptidase (beta-lactamase class C family)